MSHFENGRAKAIAEIGGKHPILNGPLHKGVESGETIKVKMKDGSFKTGKVSGGTPYFVNVDLEGGGNVEVHQSASGYWELGK
jgi:hypothetical protein